MRECSTFENLTDDQIRAAEQNLAAQKKSREHARWDAELVGRYFRIIRTPEHNWFDKLTSLPKDSYVTLEESLAVGGENRYVYADVVYIHIQKRDDSELTCSGFEVSHAHRKEPYLKIQPVFYSWSDFRNYLGSWNDQTGPTKHFDEITKEEYAESLSKAVDRFANP